ncbi:hypothetical protein [Paenibacillus ferrarius]|uniref:hypothetical protein n=1 Tax=Paenibacillus ferrarius TaxID=1469647 RepID=UPI003D268F07
MPAKKQFLSPIPIKKTFLFQNACTIAGISSNQGRSEENSCSFAGLMVVTRSRNGNFVFISKKREEAANVIKIRRWTKSQRKSRLSKDSPLFFYIFDEKELDKQLEMCGEAP